MADFKELDGPPRGTVLVTGANGFIGNCVARAFVRAGWKTYGLVRKESFLKNLAVEEIIPILGAPGDLSWLDGNALQGVVFDVVVSTTEQITNYVPHYNEIINMLHTIAKTTTASATEDNSGDGKKKLLVLFTSGCKDYGITGLHGSQGLLPHTEDSPLNPPMVIRDRTVWSERIFEHKDHFDAVLLRPTTVYGFSGSYYGLFFALATQAKKENRALVFKENPNSILHGTHGDDVATAYVALASPQHRNNVIGKTYNISSYRYETLQEIGDALVSEFGIEKGVKFLIPPEAEKENEKVFFEGAKVKGAEIGVSSDAGGNSATLDRIGAGLAEKFLTGFCQWVGSERVRGDVGWRDERALFSRGLGAYRVAWEAALAKH